jgi:hypothetical protein
VRPILVDLRTLTTKSISSALKRYNSIETRKTLDLETRYKLHRWLIGEFRGMRHPALAGDSRKALSWTGKSSLPAQVVVLKILLGQKFPAPLEKRLGLIKRLTSSKRGVLHRWAVHALESSRRPEAVDALEAAQTIITTDDGNGDQSSANTNAIAKVNATVEDRLSLALYRILGKHAIDLNAKAIRREWQTLGRKLPRDPVFGVVQSGSTTFVSYFGDPVAADSLFLMDTSNSMKHLTTIRKSGEDSIAREDFKIDIARTELRRALVRMREGYRFNVLAFDDAPRP